MSGPCPLRGSERFAFVIDPIKHGNIEGENWKKTRFFNGGHTRK